MSCRLLILVCASFLVGCATSGGKNAADASLKIRRGMSYDQVISVASSFEVERTFRGRGTALQYCSTDEWNTVGSYVVVWMVDDEVEGLTQYSGRLPTIYSNCQRYFREIDWGQAPADVKIKLDID